MSKTLFKITDGKFALALVGDADDPAWQAPTGGVLPDVAVADYDTETASFACQVVTGVLTSTENVTTENIDGTWCDPPEVAQIVGEDSFAIEWDVYQDPNVVGLNAYLYEHRGKRAYAYFGAGGDGVPPTAVGVVTLKSASIGGGRGAARAQVKFPFERAPDIQFGTATAGRVVFGDKDTPPVDVPVVPLAADDDVDQLEDVGS